MTEKNIRWVTLHDFIKNLSLMLPSLSFSVVFLAHLTKIEMNLCNPELSLVVILLLLLLLLLVSSVGISPESSFRQISNFQVEVTYAPMDGNRILWENVVFS